MSLFLAIMKMQQQMLNAQAQAGLLCFQYSVSVMCGSEMPESIEEKKGDPRFRHPWWRTVPFLSLIRQQYLLASHLAMHHLDTLPKNRAGDQCRFMGKQWVNALAPSNLPWINPSIVERTISTGGGNLICGAIRLQHDLLRKQLPMANAEAFVVAKNIATTPGEVVQRQPIYELLYYPPAPGTSPQPAMLICPPWINKYYILDLSEHNSLVRYLTQQGFPVFMISWRNPQQARENAGVSEYIEHGLHQSCEFIRQHTPYEKIHISGYCLGGTATSCYLSSTLANKAQFLSCTLLAALVDFSDSGDSGLFVSDNTVQLLQHLLGKQSIMSGDLISLGFRWLRPNHLIWPDIIRNYWQDGQLPSFDVLHWNADTCNLPLDLYLQTLKYFYIDNTLIKPNGFNFDSIRGDIQKMTTKLCIVGAEDDHITPWQSIFRTAEHSGSQAYFILSSSGHILGIINPPESSRATHFYAGDTLSKPADTWLSTAEKRDGSWWPHWIKWLSHEASAAPPHPIATNQNQSRPRQDNIVCRAYPQHASEACISIPIHIECPLSESSCGTTLAAHAGENLSNRICASNIDSSLQEK